MHAPSCFNPFSALTGPYTACVVQVHGGHAAFWPRLRPSNLTALEWDTTELEAARGVAAAFRTRLVRSWAPRSRLRPSYDLHASNAYSMYWVTRAWCVHCVWRRWAA